MIVTTRITHARNHTTEDQLSHPIPVAKSLNFLAPRALHLSTSPSHGHALWAVLLQETHVLMTLTSTFPHEHRL